MTARAPVAGAHVLPAILIDWQGREFQTNYELVNPKLS
jgi:hypothetical protein